MHDRDMTWKSADGRSKKIRDMSSDHLVNILNFVDVNISAYNNKYGKERVEYTIYNIKQEIRLRKLNRIQIDNNEELF